MIWEPISCRSRLLTAFTLANVPTGMYSGVSIAPCGVSIRPSRASLCASVFSNVNITRARHHARLARLGKAGTGDILYLGGKENAGDLRFVITSSGTASKPMSLIGADRGHGGPELIGTQIVRSYATVRSDGNSSYRTIKDFSLERCEWGACLQSTCNEWATT